jgi:hypothetical protein
MSNTSPLLSLHKDLIYKIAAEDTSVYNCILRLCRAMTSLFPLSIRLDFMIDFGVSVCIGPDECVTWTWNGDLHDIWGAANYYSRDAIHHFYRGKYHRDHRPASVGCYATEWYTHGTMHRDISAAAGTGVEWLRGAARINMSYGYRAVVAWHVHGTCQRGVTIVGPSEEYTQVVDEMDYWRAHD